MARKDSASLTEFFVARLSVRAVLAEPLTQEGTSLLRRPMLTPLKTHPRSSLSSVVAGKFFWGPSPRLKVVLQVFWSSRLPGIVLASRSVDVAGCAAIRAEVPCISWLPPLRYSPARLHLDVTPRSATGAGGLSGSRNPTAQGAVAPLLSTIMLMRVPCSAVN